jgi:hypothetical protein
MPDALGVMKTYPPLPVMWQMPYSGSGVLVAVLVGVAELVGVLVLVGVGVLVLQSEW